MIQTQHLVVPHQQKQCRRGSSSLLAPARCGSSFGSMYFTTGFQSPASGILGPIPSPAAGILGPAPPTKTGILPTPLFAAGLVPHPSKTYHVGKRKACSSRQKTQLPSSDRSRSHVPFKPKEAVCSELWSGLSFVNSPDPSSVPIPKFCSRTKGTISHDLANKDSASESESLPREELLSTSDSSNSPSKHLSRSESGSNGL